MTKLSKRGMKRGYFMNKGQTRGMLAIGFGFLIITFAGIALSFLAINVLTTPQTFISAIIVFIVSSPLFGYGILTYARSTEDEAYATNDDMEKPRLLLDYLHEHGQSDISILAKELDTTPSNIKQYINELSELSLFSGIIDWDNGLIALAKPSVIEALDICKSCKNPIKIYGNVTTCQHCGTEYYRLTD